MGCYFSRKPLKTLIFQGVLCYNEDMKNEVNITASNTEMMTISRAEYESLKAERDELNQKLDWLMEQMRLTKKKVYGASSEQTKEELIGQLSFMFDETEAWLSTRRAATRESKVAAHTRQKRSSRVEEVLPGNVPVEVVEHHVPESERACPECGTLMTEIGNEVRRTLVMIPAQVKIREDVYFTYACQNCKQTGTETPILKAEKEPPLISGSYASPEAVAHIMVQKFVMYAPLYRQEQEWNRAGVMLSRQTMSNWVLRVAEDWLRPIYDQLHRRLLQREVLHADELCKSTSHNILLLIRGDGIMTDSQATCELLYRLGISPHYKGFFHTAYAVSLCMEQQDRLLLVTKWLYPDVAKKYGTNWKAVERNIRTASAIAWKRNRPLLESLAERHLDRRLCSAEFLALLFHTVLFNEYQKSPDL